MTPKGFAGVKKYVLICRKNKIMDPILGAGIASAAGSLLGNVLGFGSQQSTNKANMELAKYQYQKDLEMWNRANEYNSPMAQMQRLKDAGLNPNMVYGSGSAANQAAKTPSYQAPRLQAYTNFGDLGAGSIIGSMLTAQQVKNLEEQNKLLQYDAVSKRQGIIQKAIEINALAEDYQSDRWLKKYNTRLADLAVVHSSLDYDMKLVDYEMKKVEPQIQQWQLDTIKQKFRQEYYQAEMMQEDKTNYLELGVKPSDPLWTRVLTNVIMDVLGKDTAKELLRKFLFK